MTRSLTTIEQKFCAENEISFDLALGERLDKSPINRIDPFWINSFTDPREEKILSQVNSIQILGRARFANAVIKLCNAYLFAETNNIKLIYHPGFDFMIDDFTINGIRFLRGSASNGCTLKSGFFYNKTLAPLIGRNSNRYELIREMTSSFKFNLAEKRHADSEILTIHIRSGDIFKAEIPHFKYGQPPLSFYKKILSKKAWNSVELVYEDDSNPVINALKIYMQQHGINFTEYSSDLKGDIEILARATSIVIGRGTFIYPIICMSSNIRSVYYFHNESSTSWGLNNKNINFYAINDLVGNYASEVLSFWKKSPAQLALMLSYPEEFLG